MMNAAHDGDVVHEPSDSRLAPILRGIEPKVKNIAIFFFENMQQ